MELLRIYTALTSVESDRIHMTWVLQKIIESGKVSIKAISYDGDWGEVDSIKDLEAYHSGPS